VDEIKIAMRHIHQFIEGYRWRWRWIQIALIVIGFLSTIFAAITNADTVEWSKYAVLVLAALTTALTSANYIFRFADLPLQQLTASDELFELLVDFRSRARHAADGDAYKEIEIETRKTLKRLWNKYKRQRYAPPNTNSPVTQTSDTTAR
jgi:hypothetical protein